MSTTLPVGAMNNLSELSVDTEGVEFPPAEQRGPLVRISGNSMVEQEIKAGTVLVTARYEKSVESEKFPGSIDYFFRGAKDSLIILKGNASVKREMAAISPGELARITYTGTYVNKKGPGKGKTSHGFKIEGALSAE